MAATSQELSQSGKSPDPSRAGTKYLVQGIPHFDYIYIYLVQKKRCQGFLWVLHGRFSAHRKRKENAKRPGKLKEGARKENLKKT